MSRRHNILLCLICIACTCFMQAGIAQDKSPIPSKSDQKEALGEIKEIFREAYRDRSAEGTRLRAAEFMKTGLETEDSSTDQFVLLNIAREDSIQLGDVANAMKACDAICERFEINAVDAQIDTLKQLSRNLPDLPNATLYMSVSDRLAETLIANDDYPNAEMVLEKMQSVARKGDMNFWNDELKTKLRNTGKLSKAFEDLSDEFALLESQPEDPDANLAIGLYYGLTKADFETSLNHLVNGPEASAIVSIAQNETAAENPKQKLAVADQWWEFASSPPEGFKLDETEVWVVQRHAVEIYRSIVEENTGLTRARIEERLAEFNMAYGGAWLEALTSQPWRIAWGGQSNWDEVRFSRKGIATIILENDGGVKEYAWTSISDTEIKVEGADVNRTYVLSMAQDGTLVGKRFNSKNGEEMSVGSSRPLVNK